MADQTKYQTLTSFFAYPFGIAPDESEVLRLAKNYESYRNNYKIRLKGICQIDDVFYYHIIVPSESQKTKYLGNYSYDVVIRFFAENPAVKAMQSLGQYYVQFYSNCPSFMFTYAYIYKQEGYLIEALYDKLDPDYINVPPTKTNPSMKKCYDKSIYMATRFLLENPWGYLSKNSINTLWGVKKDQEKFFEDISDFKSVKLDQEVINEEKKLQKQTTAKGRNQIKRNLRKIDKKIAAHNKVSGSPAIHTIKKINGEAHIVRKKGARRTTQRRRK